MELLENKDLMSLVSNYYLLWSICYWGEPVYTPIGNTFAIIMDRSLIVVEAGLFELCTRLRVILLDGAKCALYFFLLESSVVIGKKLLH